jgi:hypothetical protein
VVAVLPTIRAPAARRVVTIAASVVDAGAFVWMAEAYFVGMSLGLVSWG